MSDTLNMEPETLTMQDNETETNDESLLVLEEENDVNSVGKFVGQCKWFNDLYGYGFVTICDGDDKGKDIFVHHSGIKPLNSNYRTLKKGEYLNFNVVDGMNGVQAVDVTGINGGPLMCDFANISRKGWEDNSSNVRFPVQVQRDQDRSENPKLPNPAKLHPSSNIQQGQWLVVTKSGRKKNIAKYSKEGRAMMKQAKQQGVSPKASHAAT